MDQTLGEEKWGHWEKTWGCRPEKKGRWRDPRNSPWPRESYGVLCKPQPFSGVWRYGQALFPHGSLVPGGLRSTRGVAGGPELVSGLCPSLPRSCSPLRGGWGGFLSRSGGWGGEASSGLCARSPWAISASLSGRGISLKVLCEPVKTGPKPDPHGLEKCKEESIIRTN